MSGPLFDSKPIKLIESYNYLFINSLSTIYDNDLSISKPTFLFCGWVKLVKSFGVFKWDILISNLPPPPIIKLLKKKKKKEEKRKISFPNLSQGF